MCCIFTCCGWMIDLLQRAWVFFMSCCIATAVCCVLLITSMSGVALGYNYSLAEYIELKETNVSVYLKRGIFDDDIGEDKDMRRRSDGGMPNMPIKGLGGDDEDMITAGPGPEEPEQVPDARRRLEDSILHSDEHNKFEGNLMKLTAKAAYETTVTEPVTFDQRMDSLNSYPPGSLQQMKAIQALINEQKMKAIRDPNDKRMSSIGYDAVMLAHKPVDPSDYRKMMGPQNPSSSPKSKNIDRFAAARKAVPDTNIGAESYWKFPKLTPTNNVYKEITYPKPVYMNLGPIRPTQAISSKIVPTPTKAPKQMEPTPMEPELLNKEEMVGDIANKFEMQRPLEGDIIQPELGGWKKSEIDYYDDDIKGLPVRKRRSINTIRNNLIKEPQQKINFSESEKEKNARPNEIPQELNKIVNKLLFSNNRLSSDVTVSNDIKQTTKIKTVMNGDNNFANVVSFLKGP